MRLILVYVSRTFFIVTSFWRQTSKHAVLQTTYTVKLKSFNTKGFSQAIKFCNILKLKKVIPYVRVMDSLFIQFTILGFFKHITTTLWWGQNVFSSLLGIFVLFKRIKTIFLVSNLRDLLFYFYHAKAFTDSKKYLEIRIKKKGFLNNSTD